MSQDAANTNSVVPSRLIECEGVFKANVYKKASALSQNYFTPAALEFSMREWRQEAKKYIAEHGEAAGVEAQSMPMTSGLGKGHAGKRTGAKAGRKRSGGVDEENAAPKKKTKRAEKPKETVGEEMDGEVDVETKDVKQEEF